jgi:NAD(P)H-hydrate epimerase
MRPLVTPEEMAAADKAAVASGTSVEILMERAGRAVARTAIRMLGGRYGKKVVVVCGKGNNGGDGYVAARVLAREGVAVRCLAVTDPSELAGAARYHYEKASDSGVPIRPFQAEGLSGDLVIDAILGTGFTGHMDRPGTTTDAVRMLQDIVDRRVDPDFPEVGPQVLAVDIPSGISGARGLVGGTHVIADRTVTMGAEKLGTFLAPPEYTGPVEVADIGLPLVYSSCDVLQREDVARVLPHRRVDSHKRSGGALLVIAGSDAMTGAAALVVRGAMRSGCGYVSVACTPLVADVIHSSCPEAIVYPVTSKDHLGPEALDELSGVISNSSLIVAGPGLGVGPDQRSLIERLVTECGLPIVLDADGLNVLGDDPDVLVQHKDRLVLTPHPAELGRLFGVETDEIQADRLARAEEACSRWGAEVLLKGYRTVVVGISDGAIGWQPDLKRSDEAVSNMPRSFISPLRRFMNPTGGPELATAGTGDVLAGVVGTFLAGNAVERSTESVAAAAYVHGVAGSIAARAEGDLGVVAWDVAEALPEAIARVSVQSPSSGAAHRTQKP